METTKTNCLFISSFSFIILSLILFTVSTSLFIYSDRFFHLVIESSFGPFYICSVFPLSTFSWVSSRLFLYICSDTINNNFHIAHLFQHIIYIPCIFDPFLLCFEVLLCFDVWFLQYFFPFHGFSLISFLLDCSCGYLILFFCFLYHLLLVVVDSMFVLPLSIRVLFLFLLSKVPRCTLMFLCVEFIFFTGIFVVFIFLC